MSSSSKDLYALADLVERTTREQPGYEVVSGVILNAVGHIRALALIHKQNEMLHGHGRECID